jgi:hypothetical protein
VEEENAEDAPPRLCSFCQCNKQTTHRCDSGCYFHACADCMADACGQAGADAMESQAHAMVRARSFHSIVLDRN